MTTSSISRWNNISGPSGLPLGLFLFFERSDKLLPLGLFLFFERSEKLHHLFLSLAFHLHLHLALLNGFRKSYAKQIEPQLVEPHFKLILRRFLN